jgi:hypothetical protein
MTATTASTTRRAALGAVLAAVAIGVAPIAAGAATTAEHVDGPDGLDAGLFVLIDEAREAGARLEEAIGALDEAQERTEKVPWPQALIVTEDDTRLWKLKAGDPFAGAHVNLMRERQAYRQNLKHREPWAVVAADASWVATLDDKDRATLAIMAAAEVREDQLIAALNQWNEAREVASDRSGETAETAADERVDQLWDEKSDACSRVANTRARTLNGILAKLALIAPDFDDESASELPGEMGYVLGRTIQRRGRFQGVEGRQQGRSLNAKS